MITVWQFDDLWEDGWRFDDLVTKRYCVIDRKFAKNQSEALNFLVKVYDHIPKEIGTSKPFKNSEYLSNSTAAVIWDKNVL